MGINKKMTKNKKRSQMNPHSRSPSPFEKSEASKKHVLNERSTAGFVNPMDDTKQDDEEPEEVEEEQPKDLKKLLNSSKVIDEIF